MGDKELIEAFERIQRRSQRMQMALWIITVGIALLMFGTGFYFQSDETRNLGLFYVIAALIAIVIGSVVFLLVNLLAKSK